MMAFKGLFGGNSGDFKNASDLYGYFNDTVYAVYEDAGRDYFDIATYRGSDLIDLRDANGQSRYIVYAGSGNDTIFGGLARDTVYDQSGNDSATLAGGDDVFNAGRGDDRADGGEGRDGLSFFYFHPDTGDTRLNDSPVVFDLRISAVQDLGRFGRDRYVNFEDVSGGFGNDRLQGNGVANILGGNAGNDNLRGHGGNDVLDGSFGADTLTGDGGIDTFYCDYGVGSDGDRDVIRFLRIGDSTREAGAGQTDTIVYFDRGGGAADDRIDLSRIDARAGTAANDAFVFRGVGGEFLSRRGEVRIVETGGSSVIFVDNDRDAAAEMTIFVSGVIGLTAADFIL